MGTACCRKEHMSTASPHDAADFDPRVLIEQHQVGIWRYLRVLGCDAVLAEDLTQETFLTVLRKPFEVYSEAATAAYLRRVAYNLFISHRRRSRKETLVEDIDELNITWDRWAGQDNGDQLVENLRECLELLSERARGALEMRFRQRLQRLEIARSLEITEHGAKNLMQRAKKQLRQCVEGKMQ